MTEQGWRWDPSLYAGAAEFYARGRVPYPPQLAAAIAEALDLDGSGLLLDAGCGPGSLTLPLAHLFTDVIGIDPDAGMLAEAERRAALSKVCHVTWRQLRAEQLPAGLPAPTAVTFAQSFHWMDRRVVASAVRRMLSPGGALVHVGATTHRGMDTVDPLPHPRPPRNAIAALVRTFLGDVRRAGQSILPTGETPRGEDSVFTAAGFDGPQRLELPPYLVTRSADQVRASVYSLSSAAPHLFGSNLADFDARLRALLGEAAPAGLFSEHMRGITVSVWR